MKLIIFACLLLIGCAADPQPSISYKIENPEGRKFNAEITAGVNGLKNALTVVDKTYVAGSFKLIGTDKFWFEVFVTDQPLQITIGKNTYQINKSVTYRFN